MTCLCVLERAWLKGGRFGTTLEIERNFDVGLRTRRLSIKNQRLPVHSANYARAMISKHMCTLSIRYKQEFTRVPQNSIVSGRVREEGAVNKPTQQMLARETSLFVGLSVLPSSSGA